MSISKKALQYGQIACTQDGVLLSAQSSAGRAKKAAVLVRYASPDVPGDIVYEHSSKFEALWVSPTGHCHAISKDGFHHSDESGAWKKARVAKETLLGLGGVRGSLYASAYGGQLYHRNEAGWTEVLVDGGRAGKDWFESFDGSAENDVYAWSTSRFLHFDGASWRPLQVPFRGPGTVISQSLDDVFVVSHFGVARGNARDGFAVVATAPDADAPRGECARVVGKVQHAAVFQGDLYAAGENVYRWTGGDLERVPVPSPGIWSLAGGALLCATGAHGGILTYDGAQWSLVE